MDKTYGVAGWRVILDQYGAADVLVAIARLVHSYPGGPIEGILLHDMVRTIEFR